MKNNLYITRFLLITLLLPFSALAKEALVTKQFTLNNGLKVIVREDHRAPVIVSQLWYKVGSSYEHPSETGLSHALEHMMFKGSKKLGPGEASHVLREIGAEENAFTGEDYTAFYQVVAKDRLEIALELEADRMQTLKLPSNEFDKEIEVIKEERRLRTEDKPEGQTYEYFKTLAYPSSGYSIPTIGWMADLNRMKIEELRRWYHTWYAPNNATLVIVGDTSLQKVKPLVEHYFGAIPKHDIPKAKKPLELTAAGERRTTLHLNTQLPSLLMGFNTPSLSTTDKPREIYALRVAAALLSSGYSSRFSEDLERKQEMVSSASAWYNPFTRGDSLFVLSATPNTQKNKTIAQTEKALWKELSHLQTTLASNQELERVRAQITADLVFERDSITNQANTIGQLETVGLSWKVADKELQELDAVTAKDVQAVAKKYFTHDRVSIVYTLPKEGKAQ